MCNQKWFIYFSLYQRGNANQLLVLKFFDESNWENISGEHDDEDFIIVDSTNNF